MTAAESTHLMLKAAVYLTAACTVIWACYRLLSHLIARSAASDASKVDAAAKASVAADCGTLAERIAAAKSPHASPETLMELCSDPNADVAFAAARNPHCPPEAAAAGLA